MLETITFRTGDSKIIEEPEKDKSKKTAKQKKENEEEQNG